MSELYILRNQAGAFLGKQKDWLDGRDRGALYKTPHKDEAINQMVEVNTKDFEQRITVLACQSDQRGLPVLNDEDQAAQPEAGADAKPVSAVGDAAVEPMDEALGESARAPAEGYSTAAEGSSLADGSLPAEGSTSAQGSSPAESSIPAEGYSPAAEDYSPDAEGSTPAEGSTDTGSRAPAELY